MFTDPDAIRGCLSELGLGPSSLHYIDKGVMTDKYWFRSNGVRYVVRCFPPERGWLAETEYRYLRLFQDKGVKSPVPIFFSVEKNVLVYEMLEGKTLGEVFVELPWQSQEMLCSEIKENYSLISDIDCEGFGPVRGYGEFSYPSWHGFLTDSLDKAWKCRENCPGIITAEVMDVLRRYSASIVCDAGRLVWSDFSSDNIIVSDSGHLTGFIDFEGLMGGDSMLGLGYFLSHERNQDLLNNIYKAFGVSSKSGLLDFYSIIRLLRLLPYLSMDLPNGKKRDDISSYLQYPFELISQS